MAQDMQQRCSCCPHYTVIHAVWAVWALAPLTGDVLVQQVYGRRLLTSSSPGTLVVDALAVSLTDALERLEGKVEAITFKLLFKVSGWPPYGRDRQSEGVIDR